MTDLSERAASRCENNILRAVPSHKQAWVWSYGSDQEKEHLQAWIDENKSHLHRLRASIANGEETCIDLGWPDYADFEVGTPKKTNIERAIEENAEQPESIESGFNFSIDFLQGEFDSEKDADLASTNQRLFDEYSTLELTRPHGGLTDVRFRLLRSKFFAFKG